MKQVLEDLITTANFGNASNLVGTRTPDGGFASPGMKKQTGKWKLKKKAKVNTAIEMQKRKTMFKIEPAIWGESIARTISEKIQSAEPEKIAKNIKNYLKINKQYYNWGTVEPKDIWSDIWELIEGLYLNTKIYPNNEECEDDMEELVRNVIKVLTGRTWVA